MCGNSFLFILSGFSSQLPIVRKCSKMKFLEDKKTERVEENFSYLFSSWLNLNSEADIFMLVLSEISKYNLILHLGWIYVEQFPSYKT